MNTLKRCLKNLGVILRSCIQIQSLFRQALVQSTHAKVKNVQSSDNSIHTAYPVTLSSACPPGTPTACYRSDHWWQSPVLQDHSTKSGCHLLRVHRLPQESRPPYCSNEGIEGMRVIQPLQLITWPCNHPSNNHTTVLPKFDFHYYSFNGWNNNAVNHFSSNFWDFPHWFVPPSEEVKKVRGARM